MIVVALSGPVGRRDNRNDEGKKCPEVGEDLSDVVAAAAQHRKEGVADGAFQATTRKASIGFQVSCRRLDGAAAVAISDQPGRQSAPGSGDQHAGRRNAVAAITTVDDSQVGPVAGQAGGWSGRWLVGPVAGRAGGWSGRWLVGPVDGQAGGCSGRWLVRPVAGRDFHLFQRRGQSMAVMEIARKAAHAGHEARVQRGGNVDLAAEFGAYPRLAL